MTSPGKDYSAVAEAMDWSGRIIAIALQMILPGLAGHWLDERNGTGYWMPIGLVLGLVTAVWQLIMLVQRVSLKSGKSSSGKSVHGQRQTQRPGD